MFTLSCCSVAVGIEQTVAVRSLVYAWLRFHTLKHQPMAALLAIVRRAFVYFGAANLGLSAEHGVLVVVLTGQDRGE